MNMADTAGTGSIRFDVVEPHRFQADDVDPGYRPHCRQCGLEQLGHPYYRDLPHGVFR